MVEWLRRLSRNAGEPGSNPGGSDPISLLLEKGGMSSSESPTLPTSAPDWFIKGRGMCYCVYVIMHVKEPQSLVERSRALRPGGRLLSRPI